MFNTGNPIGSTDPRDLSDNSEIADRYVNGDDLSVNDRFGNPRKSFAGMEADFGQFLLNSGYVGTGPGGAYEDYDIDGPLTISARNEIFTKDGEFYKAKASLALPYTTSGTWIGDDETRFVSVGDAALRQDLAENTSGNGSDRVAHTGTNRSVSESLDSLYGAAVHPSDYGADENLNDNSAAVQSAIDEARVSYSESVGKFTKYVDFRGKAYKCASSIDATLIRQPGFTIVNGGIYSTASGRIALDFAGTNEPILQNFKIYGDRDSAPAAGIYHGRALINGSFPASASAKFHNVDTNGYFNKAGVINFASEVSNESQCFYVNRSRSLNAYSYINCNNAQTLVDFVGALTSDYATLPVPADGSFSNILHQADQPHMLRNADVILTVANISNTNPAVVSVDSADLTAANLTNGDEVYFYNVQGMTEINFRTFVVQNLNNAGGTFELAGEDATGHGAFVSGQVFNRTGPAVLFGGAHAVTWESGYLLTYGNDPVRIDLDGGTDTRDLNLSFHCEHSPKRIFAMYSDAGDKLVPNCKINLLQSNQTTTDEYFRVNGSGGVVFENLELEIARMVTVPASGIFANGTQFFLKNAQISVPLYGALDLARLAALGSFTGSFYAADTDSKVVRGDSNALLTFNDSVNAIRSVRIDDRATTVQLESAADRVNNEDKYAGKMVWNITTGSPVFATGGETTSAWNDATGATSHTPV